MLQEAKEEEEQEACAVKKWQINEMLDEETAKSSGDIGSEQNEKGQ